MKNIRISFSLRAFIIYIVVLGSLSWYLVNNAIERLNDGMRQSAENVMVDLSHMLATMLESELGKEGAKLESGNTEAFADLFARLKQRNIRAKIYQITKTQSDTDIYVTDSAGVVIYDSAGKALGENYSQWRDVWLTLQGEYGARTSFKDPTKTDEQDEKVMVVAAPIKQADQIVGVVSVVKPITGLEGHLQSESAQLTRYALLLLVLAMVAIYLLSAWLTHSLEIISNYARTMAEGKKTEQPRFLDQRLDNLSTSVTHLRSQLDGKEYVENYVHSLTHELKTPLTSIRGAAELLLEGLPADEQKRFIRNINASNHRMAQLVDKMLSLAKLESQTQLVKPETFDLMATVRRLLEERQAQIQHKSIAIRIDADSPFNVYGDRLLIRQAVANVLDNALQFCVENGQVVITMRQQGTAQGRYCVRISNQGELIPDYALSKIFDRFFSLPRPEQGESTTSKSTGLGLSFVREIMQLHHGTITINNRIADEGDQGVVAELIWEKQTL